MITRFYSCIDKDEFIEIDVGEGAICITANEGENDINCPTIFLNEDDIHDLIRCLESALKQLA